MPRTGSVLHFTSMDYGFIDYVAYNSSLTLDVYYLL